MPWAQLLRFISAVLVLSVTAGCSPRRSVDAGFWFEPIAYESSRLGTPISALDIQIIESTARAELSEAFADLPMALTDSPNARYKVRVVQQLWDLRFKRKW